MKITIDLNDPTLQAQLLTAIDQKITEIAADRVQALVAEVLEKKMLRLSDERIVQLTESLINRQVQAAFFESYGKASDFRQILAVITERVLRERLARPA
jgi:hypothetical protein